MTRFSMEDDPADQQRRLNQSADDVHGLSALIKAAQKKKEPTTTFAFRMPVSMYNELTELKQKYHVDMTTLIREFVAQGLRQLPDSHRK